MPVAFLFARRRGPIALLGPPPRPRPCRLPALLAAIALPRPSRTKPPLTSFEQTPPRPCPARQPLSPTGLLIFETACRTLGKAHGRSLLPEALPWRGIAILSGAQQIFRSVRNRQLYRKNRTLAPPAAARRAPLAHGRSTMISLGETEAGSAGMQPCRGITWRAHRNDDRERGGRCLCAPQNDHRIGRPLCLENPRPKGGKLTQGTTPQVSTSPPPSIRGVVPPGPPKWLPRPPPLTHFALHGQASGG